MGVHNFVLRLRGSNLEMITMLPTLRYIILTATVFAFTSECLPQSGLPSFPGAQGFGASSVGGRGGRVIFVTNRNNSGPGSFRSACEAFGPRIVIFQVGGTIQLAEEIVITNPYITIAGQTAPGGGICVKGELFGIQTHDVIVRNLRVRVGEDGSEFTHGMEIGQGCSNVIVDHCSFSWSKDALFATWDTVSNITVQECIISEVLSGPTTGHSVALGPGPGENEDGSQYMTSCSFIRNLIAHGDGRNPKVHYQAEVANNLVYNWGNIACYASMYAQLDFIGNHYIKGPSTGNVMTITLQDPRPSLRIFVSDNRTPELPTGGSNQWAIVNGSTSYQSTTRLHSSGYQPMSSSLVCDFVLDNAGAFPGIPSIFGLKPM